MGGGVTAKGLIFNVEEFAVYDGPGIRKTVFLKGCPLRCLWCHNPEGISFKKEVMIGKGTCSCCGNLIDVRNEDKCSVCGKSVDACSLNLRRVCGTEKNAKELAKELLKGSELLIKNNGGITVTGGEPLAQPEFLLELLEELKPIHTAIETSGYAAMEIFKQAVSASSLVLMDIKHADSHIHKQVTGVGNEVILRNLEYLCNQDKPFCIRVPLIPGINDTKKNMEATAELLKNSRSLIRVELLPYHMTAGAKYAMLGKEYKPAFDVHKKPIVDRGPFEKYNITCVVL